MVKIDLCDVDRVGILQREGWTKASAVPIPLKAHLLEYTENDAITANCRRGRMGALSDRVRSMEQACQVSGAYATIPSTSQMETRSDRQQILR